MKDIKQISIKRSITNNYATYKIELPHEYLQELELLGEDSTVNITYKNNKLIITKATMKLYNDLSSSEKVAQIHKYRNLYGNGKVGKELISEIEKYFGISYRTVYRALKENVTPDILAETELIDKQSDDNKNIKVFFSKRQVKDKYDYVAGRVAITPSFATAFITGKKLSQIKDMDGALYEPEKSTFHTIAHVIEEEGVKKIILRKPLKVEKVDDIFRCEMPRELIKEIGVDKENTEISIKLSKHTIEVGKPVIKLRKNSKAYNDNYDYSEEVLPLKSEYAAAIINKDLKENSNDINEFSVILETKEDYLVLKNK